MTDKDSYSIGVDIGGTKTRACVFRKSTEKIVNKVKINTGSPEDAIKAIKRTLSETSAEKNRIRGIGIGSVGPLDLSEGLIVNPTNLPTWKEVPIKKMAEEATNLPAWLDNDANVAALAERELGVKADNLIYITVSTGIGGGLISEGRLIHGKGNAGEIGHMTLAPSGPLCNCGNRGCLEALASGTAISKRGGEKLGIQDPKRIFEKAKEDNPVAERIIENACRFLGLGIANLAEIIDPEYVVLGGGVTESWNQMEKMVKSTVKNNARNEVKITLTPLGSENGLLGASLLPFVDRQ